MRLSAAQKKQTPTFHSKAATIAKPSIAASQGILLLNNTSLGNTLWLAIMNLNCAFDRCAPKARNGMAWHLHVHL